MIRRLRTFHDDGAQSLVEFALVLPLFLLIVTGIFDVARAVWQENTLAYASREGTRYAIVHGSAGNPIVGPCSSCLNPVSNNLTNVVNAVTSNAVGVYGIDVTVDYPDGGNNRLQRVTVTVVLLTPSVKPFFVTSVIAAAIAWAALPPWYRTTEPAKAPASAASCWVRFAAKS